MQSFNRSKLSCRVCLVSTLDYIDFCEPFSVVSVATNSEKRFSFTYFDCFVDVTRINVDPLEVKMPQQLCKSCSNELEQCYNFQLRAKEADQKLRQNQQIVTEYNDISSNSTRKHKEDISDERIKSPIDRSTQLTLTISIDEENFTCMVCDSKFKTKNALILHRKRQHKVLNSTAVDQQMACLLTSDVSEQNATAIPTTEDIGMCYDKISKESIVCSVCKRTFAAAKYSAHFNKAHEKCPNRYQCPKCSKHFAYRYQLKSHFEVHHGLRQKNVPCTVCSKMFYTKKLLHTHMITHQSNEINHKCNLCGKGFQRSASLRRHMIMHQGGKEQCNECAKRFPNITELRVHMLIHTKENPFLCNICGKSFRRQGPLSYHMRKHRGEKYVCEHCGQEFSCQSSMRRHEYKHTGLPFKCPRCNVGQATRGSLQRHLKEVHNSELTTVELRDIYSSVQNSRLQ